MLTSDHAPSEFAERICEAISAKRLLKLRYHGKTRILEPYLLAEYADNRAFLLAWLVRCEEDATKPPGWQHYLLSQVESLEVLEESFDGTRADYNPAGDARIRRIQCSIPTLRLV